jgi:hypothetical protein
MKSLQVNSLLKLFDLLSTDEQLEFLSSVGLEKISKASMKNILDGPSFLNNIKRKYPFLKTENFLPTIKNLIEYDNTIVEYIIGKDYVYDIAYQMVEYTRDTKFFAFYRYQWGHEIENSFILTDFDPVLESDKLKHYRNVPNEKYHFHKHQLVWIPFSFENTQFLQISKDNKIGPHDWIILDEDGVYREMSLTI